MLIACSSPDQVPVDGAPPAVPAADGCGTCHAAAEGPAGVHGVMGCVSCHRGSPSATEQDAAHAGLEREPGALDTVDQTCGAVGCHDAQAARVKGSLMATASGLIAVDRWAFGELPTPDGHETMVEVLAAADPTPAQDHVRRLCGGCHLHARKLDRDDAVRGIGSGCSACHSASRTSPYDGHPAIDLAVPDSRCLGCHSRSGRISLSYQGLSEARGVDCAEPVTLYDGRPGCRQPADAHHDAGLACTDCHLHTELMGDGATYGHEEQAVELTCQACHAPGASPGWAESTWAEVTDATSATLVRLHGQTRDAAEPVRVSARGTPLYNLRSTDGGWALQPKRGGPPKLVPVTPTDATHALAGHDRLGCGACHTAWVPHCPDCHTAGGPDGEQWDFGASAVAPGRWEETAERFGWGPPALGVFPDGHVDTVIPGMIWTLDASAVGGPVAAARRFAASQPHTTSRQGRACVDCHRSATALGLGTGELDVEGLAFAPAHAVDGVARDGWVGLMPDTPGEGTRVGLRSFDAAEQRRILRVGLCLPCHTGADDPRYADFSSAVKRMGQGSCTLEPPGWAR